MGKMQKLNKKSNRLYKFSKSKDTAIKSSIENTLKESEEKFRLIAETSLILISITRLSDGLILFTNSAFNHAYGYAKGELIGKKASILYRNEKDRGVIIKTLEKKGSINHFETKVRKKDGTTFYVSFSSKIVNFKGKKVALNAATDITERINLENQLRRKSKEQEVMLDSVPALIFFKDKENRFLRVNKIFEKSMKTPREKLEGQSLFDLYPKDEAEAYWKDDLEVIKTGKPKRGIIERMETPIGTRIVQTDKIPYLDEKGIVKGVIGFSIDITDRKLIEEKLRETTVYLDNLLNYANAPIICWDPDFRITKFNHAFERLTNYQSNDVLGKKLDILFPQEEIDKSLAKIKKTLEGEYWQDVEIPIRQKDGNVRIVLWNSANIYGKDGKTLQATIAQGHDITERVRAENQKDDFIDIASHELKTPLTSIKAFTQILIKRIPETKDEETNYMLSRMNNQIDRLTNLVVSMLDVTKIHSGKLIYQTERFDLNNLLEETADDIKITTNNTHKIKITGRINKKVTGDRYRIAQVISNLLTNAIKYSPNSDKIDIKVKSNHKDVFVSIRDYGIGVPKSEIGNLFSKFYRRRPNQKIGKGFTSLGLGLYISNEIIKRHKGKIWVKSEPNKGSVFSFSLPI